MSDPTLTGTTALTPRARDVIICDTEIYRNYFLVAMKRLRDGKVVTMELRGADARFTQDERDRLLKIMLGARIVTFNGMSFDMPIIFLAIRGEPVSELKKACDRIINGQLKYWQVEDAFDVVIPRKMDHVDLIEPQPNPFIGLKGLQGRLHGKKMQDLPFPPDALLTDEEMDETKAYCGNDLEATNNLWDALAEPMALRAALGAEYGLNFMSKSDSQIGEAIIKSRVEKLTKERIEKVRTPAGSTFPYRPPEWLKFQHPDLAAILDRLKTTDFYVQQNGKVDLPAWLVEKDLKLGAATYAMGIGGLHSTESNRAVYADEDHFLEDDDVGSYYPAIIILSGLYPKALGPAFITVYKEIREERMRAKLRVKEIDRELKALKGSGAPDALSRIAALQAERAAQKAKEAGLKIALNGVFGKLGSVYSILYAPHLMIYTTLTGQLALLMLIERAEAAGIPVVSANTDGVVFRCPRDREDDLAALKAKWEADTGFDLEATRYAALYNESVNSYVAVKEDGETKQKGPGWTGRHDGDMRSQLMKNPQMEIVRLSVAEFLSKGTPIEETIRGCRDIRDFVTVVKVNGGGVWAPVLTTETVQLDPWRQGGGNNETVSNVTNIAQGKYLGKVVRYYWAKEGAPIFYSIAHERTGNFKKVSKSDGCRPLMDLPEEFPDDIDYDRYVQQAHEELMDLGANDRPPPIKPVKVFKYNAIAWFALAA